MKQKLIMLKGLPCSGKSTFAKEYTQNMKRSVRVNNDDLRSSFYGREFNKEDESMISQVRTNVITGYLEKGYDVIVDNTNLNPIHEEELRAIASSFNNCTFEIREFPLSMELCIERDKARDNGVGEKVIRDMSTKWDYPKKVYDKVIQGFGQPCYIFDIDGTIADNSHRNPYNISEAMRDKPIHGVINIIYILKNSIFPRYKIILCSGRDESHRTTTEIWLKAHNIPYDELFMRPKGDKRKDDVVKHTILINDILPNYYVKGVFDDRNRVVDMWRQCGLQTFQVNYGDF